MSLSRRKLQALLFALAVVGFSGWLLNYPIQPKSVTVSATSLTFGDVWEQHDFKWNLEVSNPTNRTLNILEVRTSCECSGVSRKSFTLPPGGKEIIALSIDFTRLTTRSLPQTVHEPIPVEVQVVARIEGMRSLAAKSRIT